MANANDLKIFVMQNWNLGTAEIVERAEAKFGGPLKVTVHDIVKSLLVVR